MVSKMWFRLMSMSWIMFIKVSFFIKHGFSLEHASNTSLQIQSHAFSHIEHWNNTSYKYVWLRSRFFNWKIRQAEMRLNCHRWCCQRLTVVDHSFHLLYEYTQFRSVFAIGQVFRDPNRPDPIRIGLWFLYRSFIIAT